MKSAAAGSDKGHKTSTKSLVNYRDTDGKKERGGGQSEDTVIQRNELACCELTVPALWPV